MSGAAGRRTQDRRARIYPFKWGPNWPSPLVSVTHWTLHVKFTLLMDGGPHLTSFDLAIKVFRFRHWHGALTDLFENWESGHISSPNWDPHKTVTFCQWHGVQTDLFEKVIAFHHLRGAPIRCLNCNIQSVSPHQSYRNGWFCDIIAIHRTIIQLSNKNVWLRCKTSQPVGSVWDSGGAN